MHHLKMFDVPNPSPLVMFEIFLENDVAWDANAKLEGDFVSISTTELKGTFGEIIKHGTAYFGGYDHSKRLLQFDVWHDYRIGYPRNRYHDDYNKMRSVLVRSLGKWDVHGSHRYGDDPQPYHFAIWPMYNCNFALFQRETDMGYYITIQYCYSDGDLAERLYA